MVQRLRFCAFVLLELPSVWCLDTWLTATCPHTHKHTLISSIPSLSSFCPPLWCQSPLILHLVWGVRKCVCVCAREKIRSCSCASLLHLLHVFVQNVCVCYSLLCLFHLCVWVCVCEWSPSSSVAFYVVRELYERVSWGQSRCSAISSLLASADSCALSVSPSYSLPPPHTPVRGWSFLWVGGSSRQTVLGKALCLLSRWQKYVEEILPSVCKTSETWFKRQTHIETSVSPTASLET